MNVTRPVYDDARTRKIRVATGCSKGAMPAFDFVRRRLTMHIALLYFSLTEDMRNQKNRVEAIIEAIVNDKELYTRSKDAAVMGNIMVAFGPSVPLSLPGAT